MIIGTYILLWILVAVSLVGGITSILIGSIFGMVYACFCLLCSGYALKKLSTFLL